MYVTGNPIQVMSGFGRYVAGNPIPVMAGRSMPAVYQHKIPGESLFAGRYVDVPQEPVFAGLGQTGDPGTGSVVAFGVGAMALSLALSFGVMVGASYLGARWAGCGCRGRQ